MAIPLALFAAGGAGLNILQAFGNNKAVKAAEARAIAAESVKASQLLARLGRQSDKVSGAAKANIAERTSGFGASSNKLRLAIQAEALDEQSNIELNKYLAIVGIRADAANRKSNLLQAGISGALSGLSLGRSFSDSQILGGADPDPRIYTAPQNIGPNAGLLG